MILRNHNSESRSRLKCLSKLLVAALFVSVLLYSTQRCSADPRVLVFSTDSGLTNVPPQATNAVILAPGLSQVGIIRADGTPVFWAHSTNVLRTNLLAMTLSYYNEYWRVQSDGQVFTGHDDG
jgi:hypothetical protein